MNWDQAKDVVLLGLTSIVATYFGSQLRELVKSVQALNIKIAEVIGHLNVHTEKLQEHSERLEKLETRKRR